MAVEASDREELEAYLKRQHKVPPQQWWNLENHGDDVYEETHAMDTPAGVLVRTVVRTEDDNRLPSVALTLLPDCVLATNGSNILIAKAPVAIGWWPMMESHVMDSMTWEQGKEWRDANPDGRNFFERRFEDAFKAAWEGNKTPGRPDAQALSTFKRIIGVPLDGAEYAQFGAEWALKLCGITHPDEIPE